MDPSRSSIARAPHTPSRARRNMFAHVDASTLARTIARVRTIDASWTPDADADSDRARFYEERIPGSVFYDHDGACDLSSPLPQAFPPRDAFAATMGGTLGVKATDDVVVYARDGTPRGGGVLRRRLARTRTRGVGERAEGWIGGVDQRGGETERGGRRRGSTRAWSTEARGETGRPRTSTRGFVEESQHAAIAGVGLSKRECLAGAARDSAHVRIQGRSIHFDGFRVGHIPGRKRAVRERGERGGREVEAIVRRGGIGFDRRWLSSARAVDAAPAVAAALSRVGCTASVLKNGCALGARHRGARIRCPSRRRHRTRRTWISA